jgi:hypothetical protein
MSSKQVWAALFAAGLCTAVAVAQPPVPPDRFLFLENLPPLATMAARIDIIGSEGGVPGPVVKGKPYSARSITESTQTLADGNRITQRNEAVIYRDGEGRTRREQTLGGVGAWQAGEPVTIINIHDPVAGRSYTLDPAQRIARERRPVQVAIAQAREPIEVARAGVGGTWNGRDAVRVFSSVDASAVFPPGTTGMYEPAEDLGEQVLEGLLARGQRMTDTIPAGTIGNERPIEIVTERWYSEEIDALVLQRFSDPRIGETVYRLVNVVRGEPSPTLFQVPHEYEIKAPEMPRPGIRVAPAGAPETFQFELERMEPGAAPR